MTPELKAKWIAALQGGQYQQGRQTLRGVSISTGKICHCCLGVLVEVAGLEYEADINETMLLASAPEDGEDMHSSTELLQDQLDIVGLFPVQQVKLISLNDDDQWDFPAIANWIEKEL